MKDQILEYVRENLEYDSDVTIESKTDLMELGILDSLAIAQLVMFLEDTFSLELDPDDIDPENFKSVDAMVALVERRR